MQAKESFGDLRPDNFLMKSVSNPAKVQLGVRDSTDLHLEFAGDWRVSSSVQPWETLCQELDKKRSEQVDVKTLSVSAGSIGAWDSVWMTYLLRLKDYSEQNELKWDTSSLPEGAVRLLNLALTVPEKKDARGKQEKQSKVAQVGHGFLNAIQGFKEAVTFFGECSIALGSFCVGKAKFRSRDFWTLVQECGIEALPIVALISFLVGLILAFVGSLQLQQFGASIYVANLVGVAMAREMGAIMTGIIMCGRTGAAFAAQLGSMKVNEEIAAFKTFGFNPIEFLALPRMIALALMMPLLCIFADLVGILGGMVVGVGMLDLSFSEYWSQTVRGVELRHFIVGLAKVAVFGVLVAITGCLRGMQCGSSSSSVGLATTSAVVLGITCIIIADAVFAIMLNALNL